jgi:hypothetical protein
MDSSFCNLPRLKHPRTPPSAHATGILLTFTMAPAPQHFEAAPASMNMAAQVTFDAIIGDKKKQQKYQNTLSEQANFQVTLSTLRSKMASFLYRLASFQRELVNLQGKDCNRLDNFQSRITNMHAQASDVARHLVELETSALDASQDLLDLPEIPVQVTRLKALLAALDARAANLAVGFAEAQAASPSR